jgi:hypothetical protein
LLAAPAFFAFVLVAACGKDNEAVVCDGLAAPKCPDQGGLGCDDPSCETTYQCNAGGVWSFVRTCPSYVPPPDAGPDAAGASDGGPGRDAAFPFPIPPGAYGGQGCIDLQPPDCAVGTVVACADSVDPCCGCDTLFTCVDGEWIAWGECEADGGIVESGE